MSNDSFLIGSSIQKRS